MNSFSLVVRFPRTRWQANCVFRSIATRKRNETLRLWPGSAEPCEAIGARVRTQGRICNTYNLCQILTVPVGRVWRFTHFCSVALLPGKWFTCHHFVQEWQAGIYYRFIKNSFTFLLTLTPSDGYRRHLPRVRGRLTVRVLSFLGKKSFTVFRRLTYIKTMNSFFLSVSFPRNRREVPSLARR